MKIINIYDSRFDYGAVLRCHLVIDRYHVDDVYDRGYYTSIKDFNVIKSDFLNFCQSLKRHNDKILPSFWADEINPPGTELHLRD